MVDMIDVRFIKAEYGLKIWLDASLKIEMLEKRLEELDALLESETPAIIDRKVISKAADAFDSFMNYLLCVVTDQDAPIPDVVLLSMFIPHHTVH